MDLRSPTVLSVRNLHWHSGNDFSLENINLDVQQNSLVGILGPNGSGKSSLLRCLYGYLKPDCGQIELNGTELSAMTRRQVAQQLAVVTQHVPLGFSMTVAQFMVTGLLAHQRLWQRRNEVAERAQIEQWLERVDLLSAANHRYDRLSGGEQQRLLIARAMLQQPKILVLDEPTNHLDIHFQIEILELLSSLEITVVASLHDLNLAAAYCDRVLLLNRGQLVDDGQPHTVLTEQTIKAVYGVDAQVSTSPQLNIRYRFPNRTGASDA